MAVFINIFRRKATSTDYFVRPSVSQLLTVSSLSLCVFIQRRNIVIFLSVGKNEEINRDFAKKSKTLWLTIIFLV